MKAMILAKSALDSVLAADARTRSKVREDFGIEYASEGATKKTDRKSVV